VVPGQGRALMGPRRGGLLEDEIEPDGLTDVTRLDTPSRGQRIHNCEAPAMFPSDVDGKRLEVHSGFGIQYLHMKPRLLELNNEGCVTGTMDQCVTHQLGNQELGDLHARGAHAAELRADQAPRTTGAIDRNNGSAAHSGTLLYRLDLPIPSDHRCTLVAAFNSEGQRGARRVPKDGMRSLETTKNPQ
jgi:hypothetical protein